MTESRFRLLLWLYVFCLFAALFTLFLPTGYSAEIDDLIAQEPGPAIFENGWLALALLGPYIAAVFLGVLGLFRLKHWGRALSLYTTVAGGLLFPFLGPVASSGLASTMTEATSILWGAVLACAYFSPVSSRFERLRSER